MQVSDDLAGRAAPPAGGAAPALRRADAVLAATGLVSLALDPPAPRPGLALQLTATAATTVTIASVVVAYAEGGSP